MVEPSETAMVTISVLVALGWLYEFTQTRIAWQLAFVVIFIGFGAIVWMQSERRTSKENF